MEASMLSSFSHKMALLSTPSSARCKYHPDEVIQRFCNECGRFVCIECLSSEENHVGHTFRKFEDIKETKRTELFRLIKKAKEETTPDIEQKRSRAKALKESILGETRTRMNEVKSRAEELKSSIDVICNRLLTELSLSENDAEKAFSAADSNFTLSLSRLSEVIEVYEKGLAENDSELIVKGCYQFESEVEKNLPHVCVPSEGPPPLSYEKNDVALEALFGKLENDCDRSSDFIEATSSDENENDTPRCKRAFSRKRNSAIRVKKRGGEEKRKSRVTVCLSADIRSPSRISLEDDMLTIKAIASVDSELSWILTKHVTTGIHSMQQLEKDGAIGTPFITEISVGDIAVLYGGGLLLSEGKSLRVHHLGDRGMTVWRDFSPHLVTGICLLQSGGVAICVCDKHDYIINAESTRAVFILDEDAKEKELLQFKGNTKDRHFTLPTRIAENRNCDLCVVDRSSHTRGRLVVISSSGKSRFEYAGVNTNQGENFDPLDVATSGDGCIFVVDRYKGVHQITNFGKFARYLLTEAQGLLRPRSITVDEERKAWVGCEGGVVIRVWTYIEPTHRPLVGTDT